MKIGNIQRVLVPKGDNNAEIRRAFQRASGVFIPNFGGRRLVEKSMGITFYAVRAGDVPGLMQDGYADIGVTGSDNCVEAGIERYQEIGEAVGQFSLMSTAANELYTERYLRAGFGKLRAATAFPRLLSQCVQQRQINVEPAPLSVQGSLEAMPRLTGFPLVADIVCKGETAKDNGLVVIERMYDVMPAIIRKDQA
jgi:ATP phosphoribosyltransferase